MFTRLGQLEAWVQADARMLEKQLHKVRELEEQIAILEAKTEELRIGLVVWDGGIRE
jgi:cell division protein FtsB